MECEDDAGGGAVGRPHRAADSAQVGAPPNARGLRRHQPGHVDPQHPGDGSQGREVAAVI